MPRILPYLLAASCTLSLSCSKKESTATSPASDAAPAPVDACALLTSEEIVSVQGEPVQQTTPTTQMSGGFAIAQCYFALPTHTNSIVVTVTQPATSDTRALSAHWSEMFHLSGGAEREAGEKKEKTPPREVPGLGEQAYWTGSPMMGALYVLQGNRFIRISIGGPGEVDTKINKSEALAEFILKRL